MIKRVAYEPVFLSHLRDVLAIKGIRRVVLHEPLSNIRPVIFLQFAPGVARTEVWRALRAAAMLRADCGKIVVSVSDDLDPTNADEIFWSLAYRANMGEDLQVMPYRSGGHGPKSGGGRKGDSTLMIDATAKGPMPPLALPARGIHGRRAPHQVELGLPRLAPAPAVARLSARRPGRPWDVFALCQARDVDGTWAQKWPRHLRAPPRRAHAGDADARGGEEVTSM